MKSWLDFLLQATNESEAPERYFWWSGLAAISAIVRKNVYLDRFYYKLYPNIYVAIVSARSGLKKGIPINFASNLVADVGCTRVVTGRNSIQGIIKDFSQQTTLENGTVLSEAHGFLISDEFDQFIVKDPDALTILTSLHNTHEHHKGWKNTLKGSPVENLKSPCITMLAASNEILFRDMVRAKDMQGGFLARTIIVYESKRARINPLTRKPKNLKSVGELSKHLREISKVRGEFEWPEDSKQLYEKWYETLCKFQYDDRTGTLERLGDQVLKVAMLVALSRGAELVLTRSALEESIDKVQECFGGTKIVSLGSGSAETAPAMGMVLKELMGAENHRLSRMKLLKKVWPDVDAMTLDRVIDTLIESGAVKSSRGPGKEGVVYEVTEDTYRQYKEFKEELN